MRTSHKWLGAIVIVIVFWAWFSSPHHFKDKPLRFSSNLVSAPVINEVIAVGINLPNGDTITPKDVETGKYPVAAFEINPGSFIIDVPRRMAQLLQYDKYPGGIIDVTAPIYAHLALGRISPDGKTIQFTSFQAVGVRNIILDLQHIVPAEKAGLPPGMWNAHSTYVMADNSRWLTFNVPIPSKFLLQLKTTDPQQQLVPPLPYE